MLGRLSQSLDLKPTGNLWEYFRTDVTIRTLSDLMKLESCCKEEHVQISTHRYAKLVDIYPRRPAAENAANGG